MGQEKTSSRKVGALHSLAMKIIILVIASSLLATIFCELSFGSLTRNLVLERAKDSMTDLAYAYSELMEHNLELDYEGKHDILQNAVISSVEGSYTYLVASDGTILYHPTKEKVGQPVENAVVSGLVAEIQAGRIPEDGFTEYEYKGTMKYVSYCILSNNSILVTTADESNFITYKTDVIMLTVLCNIFNFVVFTIVGFLFAYILITKPLRSLTSVVNRTADFNIVKTTGYNHLSKRKDEIGAMASIISQMRGNLRNIVNDLRNSNNLLAQNMQAVVASSIEINDMCSDNSSTTQELAAGMEETSAATETINGNIQTMQEESNDIYNMTVQGDKLSESIMERAEELRRATVASNENAQNMYTSVKEKTGKAIEDSKAVSKINELTEAIMSISSQTSLLALNANIEAARAGEAGKGFAVVATEIGSLANQTAETVTNINTIVGEVNGAVTRMADTLTESLAFLENVVIKDYDQFEKVSIQYSEDASTFKTSMADIEESIRTLTASINNVAESLLGITNTVTEVTVGVTDIAGKTSDVVAKTSDNTSLIDDCLASVDTLRKIADTFKTE